MWAAGRKEAQGKQIGLPFHTEPHAPRSLHHVPPGQWPHLIRERYHAHPHPVTLFI